MNLTAWSRMVASAWRGWTVEGPGSRGQFGGKPELMLRQEADLQGRGA